MKHNIYCVIGDSGEYSDHREWIVCWLKTKAEADEYAKLANDRTTELYAKIQEAEDNDDWQYRYQPHLKNEYDPAFSISSDRPRYCVCEVPKAIWKQAVTSS